MTLTNGQQPLYATTTQQVFGPGTLPDGTEPLIFLDFKNAVYQIDGENAALNTLITENVDWGEWNPATMISPGVGLNNPTANAAPVLTGEAFTRVAAGATMVLVFTGATGAGDEVIRYEMVDDLNDYNFNYYSRLAFAGATVGAIGDQTAPDVEDGNLADGQHKTAFTMIDGKITRSTDGAANITINPAAAWSPAPTVMGFIVGDEVILETLGIYPAQDDAELPALSEL